MPRIRSIKPEFWSDAAIARLDIFTRLLYIALWTFADDEGRGRAIAKEISGYAFPHDNDIDNAQVEAALQTLAATERIVLYDIKGVQHFQVSQWKKHQKVNRATASRIEAPEGYESPPVFTIQTAQPAEPPQITFPAAPQITAAPAAPEPRRAHAQAAETSRDTSLRPPRSDPPQTYVDFLTVWNCSPEQIAYADSVCQNRPNAPAAREPERRAKYMKSIIDGAGQPGAAVGAAPQNAVVAPRSLVEMAQDNQRVSREIQQKGHA